MPEVEARPANEGILELQDVDLLRAELADPRFAARLKRLGFEAPDPKPVERQRTKLLQLNDRRWLTHYERAQARYGRGVTTVRGRVCQGCHISLPTSASPSGDDPFTTCESCGRILYWR
jgi:predicted  nucleic acid-binding Zn-ribbon protein